MPAPDAAAITAARLQRFAARCDYLAIAPHLDREAKAAGIDTPREVRHWLAQLHHESQGFTLWTENLNWRDPARLDALFASVKGVADAEALIRRGPAAIANRIYAGKGGNGDEASGDGWKFRGRSPIQLTLRGNYLSGSAYTGLDLVANPDQAATYPVGARIAAQWWRAHGLNEIVAADPGERAVEAVAERLAANEFDDVLQARRVINGRAALGLDEVKKLLLTAGFIWPD